MNPTAIRRPQLDWSGDVHGHWGGDNHAVAHAFNALSFLLPPGERFFIDVVREVIGQPDFDPHPRLAREVKAFMAQEAAHGHQHALYNAALQRQGFDNVVEGFVRRLQRQAERYCSPLTRLAIVCGYEHYTAILGNFLLRHPQILDDIASPQMKLLWGWHAAEETEHKAVCFDLYQAAGGGWLRRILVFLLVTLNFHVLFGRLYCSLLYRNGSLKPPRWQKTGSQFLRFFFGRPGVAWHLSVNGLRYLGPRFHPWNDDNKEELDAWLNANRSSLHEASLGDTTAN